MSMTPPAGWYPDPGDASQQRYWDGATWTANTQPGAAGGYEQPGNFGSAATMTYDASYAPDPNSIGSALTTVKAAFWRLVGLILIAAGASLVIGVTGSLITGGLIRDAFGGVQCTQTYYGTECGAGPNMGAIIFAFLLIALIYGGMVLLGLWIFAAFVRIIRGQQAGQRVGVGMSLSQTWPRAWRFMALGLGGFVILAVGSIIVSLAANASAALGVLLGLVLFAVAIVVYVGIAGLYAWLLSPTGDEV